MSYRGVFSYSRYNENVIGTHGLLGAALGGAVGLTLYPMLWKPIKVNNIIVRGTLGAIRFTGWMWLFIEFGAIIGVSLGMDKVNNSSPFYALFRDLIRDNY